MIPENYDELTVDETLDAVADAEGDELEEFIDHERDNKNRVSVLEPLLERLDDSGASQEEVEAAVTDDSEAETADDDDGLSRGDTVTVQKTGFYGYAAGMWFDESDETKEVEVNTRIQRAIDNGELEVVEG